MNTVVFDVETKKTFDEVGGFYPDKLEISVVGVWHGEDGGEGVLEIYREEQLGEMFKIFELADRIVGFNSVGFDYVALKPYYSGDLTILPSLDIMLEVEKDVGHRVKLDAIAKETLNIQKSGDGLDAVRYFRAGDWESLEKYCLQDVDVTRKIYEYGRDKGVLSFKNKWNNLIEAKVDFSYSEDEGKKVQTTLF